MKRLNSCRRWTSPDWSPRLAAQEEPIAAIDEKTVTEVAESNGWDEDTVRELIAAGRLLVGLDGCCAVLPPPPKPMSVTEITQALKREAQREHRMAAIRVSWEVYIPSAGGSLMQNFSGTREECVAFADEHAKRTRLAVSQTSANVSLDTLTAPGIYLVPSVFDEMAPGETRCRRTFGQHY